MHYSHARKRIPSLTAELEVRHRTFEHALAHYPNCKRIALRAFTRSEAARYANALIRPREWDEAFANVVALFGDQKRIAESALRAQRFDFQFLLLKSGIFEQRIAARLVREGKLSAGVLL